MNRFLSSAWFAERATATPPDAAVDLTIQQRVTGGPEGDVEYVLRLSGTSVTIEVGTAPDADVTITETYDTALAVHEGRLTAAAAVAAGSVHVSGAVSALLTHGAALEAARA